MREGNFLKSPKHDLIPIDQYSVSVSVSTQLLLCSSNHLINRLRSESKHRAASSVGRNYLKLRCGLIVLARPHHRFSILDSKVGKEIHILDSADPGDIRSIFCLRIFSILHRARTTKLDGCARATFCGLESDRHRAGISNRHERVLKEPIPAIVAYIVKVNNQVFGVIALLIVYSDGTQPIDGVRLIEGPLFSNELLLQVGTLDLKRKLRSPLTRSVNQDLARYELV